MEDTISVKGKYNSIKHVNPETTYFEVHYKEKTVFGKGLFNTGWKELPDGILKVIYRLSNGVLIEIPNMFNSYLHLVEVSQSVLNDKKIFHYVYIKGKKDNGKVISYRISLKEDKENNINIGDVHISEEEFTKSNYWKKANIG